MLQFKIRKLKFGFEFEILFSLKEYIEYIQVFNLEFRGTNNILRASIIEVFVCECNKYYLACIIEKRTAKGLINFLIFL